MEQEKQPPVNGGESADESPAGYVAARMHFESQRLRAEDLRNSEAADINRRAAGIAASSAEPSQAAGDVPDAEESREAEILEDLKDLYDSRPLLEARKRRRLEGVEGVDVKTIEIAVSMILEAIGEDLSREDLSDTPRRVAKFYKEFFAWDAGNVETYFNEPSISEQMVTVSNVRVWSFCAHHLLPFYTDVSMGYLAEGGVLGLSKFPRIAHAIAHRLQTQESIAEQIADEIERVTGTRNVAVLCENGMHTCATMRGIRTPCSMNNSVMRGIFRHTAAARAEFYNLIQRSRRQP